MPTMDVNNLTDAEAADLALDLLYTLQDLIRDIIESAGQRMEDPTGGDFCIVSADAIERAEAYFESADYINYIHH